MLTLFLCFLRPPESETFDSYEQTVFDPAQTVHAVDRVQEAQPSPRSRMQKLCQHLSSAL